MGNQIVEVMRLPEERRLVGGDLIDHRDDFIVPFLCRLQEMQVLGERAKPQGLEAFVQTGADQAFLFGGQNNPRFLVNQIDKLFGLAILEDETAEPPASRQGANVVGRAHRPSKGP